jgi:hypothetical protein
VKEKGSEDIAFICMMHVYIFFASLVRCLCFPLSRSRCACVCACVRVYVCMCAGFPLPLLSPPFFSFDLSFASHTYTHRKKKSRCSLYSRRTPLRSSIRGQEECSKAKLSSPLFSPCYFSTCLLPECVLPSPPHCFPSLLLLKSPTEQKQDNNINRAKSAAAPTQKNGPGNYGRPV